MIWYFKDEVAYEYPSGEAVINDLTNRYHKSVYEDSNEMEIYYALAWMKDNEIDRMSVAFPIKDLSVNVGNDYDINMDYCKEHSIHVRYENRVGGCIVLFPGNIITLDISPVQSPRRYIDFSNEFIAYLGSRGVNAYMEGNDIMADGKKIMGAISQALPGAYEGWVYFGVSISVNTDADLIDKICTKPMEKIPGALSDYGITTDELMKFVLDWFYKHMNDI